MQPIRSGWFCELYDKCRGKAFNIHRDIGLREHSENLFFRWFWIAVCQLNNNFGRYCNASAKWTDWISSLPVRSAMVRASLRIRWYARADKLSCVIAARIKLWPSSCSLQNCRISPTRISALQMMSELPFEKRFCCTSLAACTHFRIIERLYYCANRVSVGVAIRIKRNWNTGHIGHVHP